MNNFDLFVAVIKIALKACNPKYYENVRVESFGGDLIQILVGSETYVMLHGFNGEWEVGIHKYGENKDGNINIKFHEIGPITPYIMEALALRVVVEYTHNCVKWLDIQHMLDD